MLVRVGKVVVVFALATMLVAQWALLQTVAWTTMFADNLHSNSFSLAVEKTFDGQHPCPLCKAIDAGKKSEQKSGFTAQTQRLEFPPTEEHFVFIAPARFQFLPLENFFAKSFLQKPPTPPPRAA